MKPIPRCGTRLYESNELDPSNKLAAGWAGDDQRYGKSTKAPMKRSIDKTVQIESALQTKDIISGPIQIDISDPWTIEKIWNGNPSSGLPDPSLLQSDDRSIT